MKIDIAKTRKYYEDLSVEDLCQCDDCLNFYGKVKKACPQVSEYLAAMGVDITKPFETWAVDMEDGTVLYPEAQYIVFGDREIFQETKIEDIQVHLAGSHPLTDIKDVHFVIELGPIVLDR